MLRSGHYISNIALLVMFQSGIFFSQNIFAQCSNVNFSADIIKGCPLLAVKFFVTGASSASGATFLWDFGNGYVNGSDTITKAFSVQGKYTVKLLATLAGAGSACPVVEKDTFISVFPVPSPVMSANPGFTICDSPANISLTDITPGITNRYWIVNAVKDTSKTIHFPFSGSGPKTISLFVINSNGCRNSVDKILQLYDSVPVDIHADFTATPSYTKAIFSPHIGKLGINTITGYSWSFPGGVPSSSNLAQPPVVVYTDITKKYDVSLTVTMASGCSYTALRKEIVYPFLTPAFKTECADNVIKVYGGISNNGRFNYNFRFQGGEFLDSVGTTNYYGPLKYPTPGKYAASLSYYLPNGSDSISINYPVYLTVTGPAAAFSSADNHLCTVGDTVHFINGTDTGGAPKMKYTWYIFDSTDTRLVRKIGPVSAYNTQYAPSQNGKYGVALVAVSSNGCKDSTNKPDFVSVLKPISGF